MCSFDVQSLFTQIPLAETINIIIDLVFENNQYFHSFNKKQFKELLELATLNSYFIFNDKLYKQVDGVAMGSPLGPTLANIFLNYNEKIWLNICPTNFKPNYYKRYVDDTFVLFDDPNKSSLFLNYLNSKHPNIKFTIETENEEKLPFLDILITRLNNNFITSVYRKPAFTGMGLNYLSFTSYRFKINSVKTLIYRTYHHTSHLHTSIFIMIFNFEEIFLLRMFILPP